MNKHELTKKFDHIYRICLSEPFRKMESLGGEVPFFISTFDPADQNEVESEVGRLINRLERDGIHVKLINLFDLCVQLLKDRGMWDKLLEVEPSQDKQRFQRIMQQPLNPEKHLAPAIRALYESSSPDLVFITGVGMVFPFLRSHTILNNLQSIITEVPTVMFFPGQYDGTKLELFGRMKDDNYYRAFHLDTFNG